MAENDNLVSENIKEVFKKYLDEKKINVSHIDINAGSIRGDNYLGVIARAEITGTDANGKPVSTSYIIKSAPKAEGLRQNVPIRFAYQREMYIYNKVLPEMKKFQEEKGVKNPFHSVANCLTTCNEEREEAIILEDMKTLGYVMQNRKKPLDYNHVKLVLTELGRFHAISFAIMDQNPTLFEEYRKIMKESFMSEMNMEPFDTQMNMLCDKAEKTLNPETDQEVIEKFKEFRSNSVKSFQSILTQDFYPYCVIRHGDSWTNNFLFAYKDETQPRMPTNLCILDWQISHVSAPVLDLLYFIFATTDKELRDNHYDELLKHYHNTLTEFTAEMGSDINRLYPYDIFMQQLQENSSFGLICGLMLLPILISESGEMPDMNEIFETDDIMHSMEAFNIVSKNNEEYEKRVRDVCYFMAEKNYI